MADVVIYTTLGCPDCAAVKKWFETRNIEYKEIDIARPGVKEEIKKKYGVRIAPITVVGNQFFYGTFKDQLPKLKSIFKEVKQ